MVPPYIICSTLLLQKLMNPLYIYLIWVYIGWPDILVFTWSLPWCCCYFWTVVLQVLRGSDWETGTEPENRGSADWLDTQCAESCWGVMSNAMFEKLSISFVCVKLTSTFVGGQKGQFIVKFSSCLRPCGRNDKTKQWNTAGYFYTFMFVLCHKGKKTLKQPFVFVSETML